MNIKNSFNALKDFLITNVPELGRCFEHFTDPFLVGGNQFIMLPDGISVNDDKNIIFSVNVFASTIGKSIDDIPQNQMALAQKMYSIINLTSIDNIISMKIENTDFFDPATPTHNVGLVVFKISCLVGSVDDCGEYI